MALERITVAPTLSDFTPLAEHQEQTPTSFFDNAKPVLHNHHPDTDVKLPVEDLDSSEALLTLHDNGTVRGDGEEIELLPHVDIWVTSTHLILWSLHVNAGVKIPYQTITVHAQEGEAVFLGLNLSDKANTADEDMVFVQMRVYPVRPAAAVDGDASNQPNGHTSTSSSASKSLFEAISACQELNPDPPEEGDEDEDEDEDGEFDSTAPGAGGWITSENMADFVDENGEFRLPGGDAAGQQSALGNGAGIRRAAEEDAEDEDGETKWQRTG